LPPQTATFSHQCAAIRCSFTSTGGRAEPTPRGSPPEALLREIRLDELGPHEALDLI
jgi:hypothetical protein